MKILFVYSIQKSIVPEKPLLGQEGIYHGLSTIAGKLYYHGHDCELVVLDSVNSKRSFRILKENISMFNPEIIAFTAVFSEFKFIRQIAERIKMIYPNIFLIAGGVHITLNPDENYLSFFDAICIGEGEYPMLELVENIEQQKLVDNIQNLWVKTVSGVKKNPIRPFVQNLDEVSFSYRDMWQKWILNPITKPTVLLGRGCPYRCTYCSNHKLRNVSSGKYVRMRSPENIIEEIRNLYQNLQGITEIYLEVETIVTDRKWLQKLCDQLEVFSKEISFRLKFSTNLRVFPNIDIEYILNQFKRAGITSITIGLESGNYLIRKNILYRDYTNEQLLEVAKAAKERGIDIALFNMIGLPTETPAEFAETLLMNQLIQPTYHATSIFFPYPGTKLAELCKQMNLISKEINIKDERQLAVLDLPGFSKRKIQKSFDSFHYHVYKKRKHKSLVHLFIYFSMCFLGHNFYANLKIIFIRILYRTKILNSLSSKWFSIFQKSGT